MFQYQDPSTQYRSNRRRPNRKMAYGFPWFFIFFIWFAPGYWWAWIAVAAVFCLASYVMRQSAERSWSQQQTPYYQPSAQMKATEVPYYQPYEQGYHTDTEGTDAQPRERETASYKEPETSYPETSYEEPEVGYQEYEQPTAEYPQQLPPM